MGKFLTCAISALGGMAAGIAVAERTVGIEREKEIRIQEENYNKSQEFYAVLVQWLHNIHNGFTLEDYLEKKGYKEVAIYGFKELGVCLLEELQDSDVKVVYGIDRDADSIYVPCRLYKPDESLPRVDAVIVTAIHYFDDIKAMLEGKINCPIISLEDIVFGR